MIPMVWPWVSKYIWAHAVTVYEVLLHLGIVIVTTAAVFYIGMCGQTVDIEVWNGEVTGKEKAWTSCSHSYQCNCRNESCGKDCTTYVCDTCYEHSNDWDWNVYSNINDTTTINRVDRRGSNEPPRWTAVKIGEPYSDTKMFENYIKGAPDSLFNDKDLVTKYANLIPEYPARVHDYYRLNHVLSVGVPVSDLVEWNSDMATILKGLGPKKEANVVIVIAKTNQVDYAKALKEAWLGGKKNDTIIIIGSSTYPTIDFVDVFSWSSKTILDVELRNAILDVKTLDRKKIIPIITQQINTNFRRRSMEEFAYLKDEIVPPPWLLILTSILSICVSAGVSYFTITVDIFNQNRRRY